MNSSYLDYNATAPLRPEARTALLAALEAPANPSSVHRFGRNARGIADIARGQVADLVRAEARRVVFTSGGTEANNLALRLALEGAGVKSLVITGIEHDSVLRPARHAGLPTYEVVAGADGVVSLGALEATLGAAQAAHPGPALVALMLANNETGAIQPVAEAARLAHAHQSLLLCDAVQAAGKIQVNLSQLDADFLTLSAHKLGGPTGVGALITRDDWTPAPLLRGGGQEKGMRAGTENLGGIAGFGAAAAAAQQGMYGMKTVAALRDRLQAGLLAVCPEAPVYGTGLRLPNTLCIGMPGVPAETQVMALDLAGVAVSAGSACSSGKVTPSHVLTAMGLPEAAAREAIRFSLGWASRPEDVDRAIEAWCKLWQRKRK
ncbi:cysteine desulfurase [Ferrovibrio terrae]|uniref:Cysteine desulfurase n=1 Tax=Ferrovibrio terrae TaxID=2594003 RepID=A0A516H3F7_9PROT|nr:cysteine desulfurase family protein [Ferrovibrio terrae]QDO98304.1 cysteine desulfurase [Ferrovibrio terrae]